MSKSCSALNEYLGGKSIAGREVITVASLLVDFPDANFMQMKTDKVKISVNGTDAFITTLDDKIYLRDGTSFMFMQNCEIALGTLIPISN